MGAKDPRRKTRASVRTMNASGLFTRRQALGALGAATALSACGPQSSAPIASVAPGAVQKVPIVMTQGVSGLTVHEVARAKGFFTEFGVDPEVLLVSDGGKCIAALLSGSAKMCAFSGFNQLTPAIERGADIKILAGALNIASLAMYSGKDEIKTVADLKGKSLGIGAAGSVLHQMTVLLLRKKGVDPASVTFRNVGSNADVFKAVSAKTVDAGLSDVDVFDRQAEYGVHALPDGLLWKEIPEYTNQGSYATNKAIAEERDLLVRILAAYAKAYRYVSSPESQADFVAARKTILGTDEGEHALTQWKWIQDTQPYAKDLVLSDERINFVQQLNIDFKIQKTIMPIAKVADMTLAQDAIKRLG
jgi:ABC-type nitrate/sulfonate/bicarbonate transport system substrate-binding protein